MALMDPAFVRAQVQWAQDHGYPVRQQDNVLMCQINGEWKRLVDLWDEIVPEAPVAPAAPPPAGNPYTVSIDWANTGSGSSSGFPPFLISSADTIQTSFTDDDDVFEDLGIATDEDPDDSPF